MKEFKILGTIVFSILTIGLFSGFGCQVVGGSAPGSCDAKAWMAPGCPDLSIDPYVRNESGIAILPIQYTEEYKACRAPLVEQYYIDNGCGSDMAKEQWPNLFD